MPFTGFPYGVTTVGNTPVLPNYAVGLGTGFGGTGNNTNPGLSNVYFVNSTVATASDASDHGSSPQTPFKSLNFALTRTLANNGDVVYVGPGHVETVSAAAGLTFPTATAHGVTVYFQGNEVDRAQINYTTSTAATVTIPANNVTIVGARIVNAIDARVDGLVITGADCKLIGCEWVDGTGTSSLISVRTTTAAVRLRLMDCRCYFAENTGTARTEFIRIVGGSDHEITNFYNDQVATFSTAVINNVTTASNGFLLRKVIVQNGTTAVAAAFVAGSTIQMDDCLFGSTGVSAITLPTFGNYLADQESTVVGGFGTATVHQAPISAGGLGAFQKSFTSSVLTTSPQTFITCTGGSVLIEGITVETDATGLAGGTNHQLLTNNANGLATLAAETVANLGANKTIDLTAASVTALKTGFVLESTKVLQLDNTVGAGTGAGKIFYNVRYRILSGAPVLS